MFRVQQDGTVIADDGRILLFSIERFIENIVEGDACFICGSARNSKQFNDEHVLPKWILRKYAPNPKSITLPNEIQYRYDKYKVPCCKECNSKMARIFEEPMSQMTSAGYQALSTFLREDGPGLVFIWLALNFFKIHYKDRQLRYILDRREESPNIADFYNWSTLHHLHCITRAFYTLPILDKSIFGTVFVLPAKTEFQVFDVVALYESQSILLKLGETAFIAVLNDAGAAFSSWGHNLSRIRGPLSHLQLREILSIVSAINLHLRHRPIFKSSFDPSTGKYKISATYPRKVEIDESQPSRYGEILHFCCREYLDLIRETFDKDIESHLLSGNWSFLFNQDGEFISNSI